MDFGRLNRNAILFNKIASLPFTYVVLLFTLNASAFGQEIKDRYYYAIPSRGISQLIIKGDTLKSRNCVDYKHCVTPAVAFLIIKSVKRNNYNLLITSLIENNISDSGKFNLILIKDQTSGDYLQMVSENYLYNSIAECEAVIGNYNPESKIYFTFFTIDDLHKFETFRKLSSLTNDEGKNVFTKLKDVVIENKPQFSNTRTGDMYGMSVLKELASRVLIENKINPMVSEDDLDEFIKKYM